MAGASGQSELIQTLPPAARFATSGDKFWLANPDTPEGCRYYQAQVEALLAAYPQITCLVVWFRAGGTPWMEFTPAECRRAGRRSFGPNSRGSNVSAWSTASTFVLPPEAKLTLGADLPTVDEEIGRAGIESDQPIQITLAPVMGGAALPQGEYRVTLLFLEPSATAEGQRVFDVAIGGSEATPVQGIRLTKHVRVSEGVADGVSAADAVPASAGHLSC